jgi:hypothetical protein
MRLPSKKRPGNPILAKDWNLLIDALEARTPRPGPGTEIVATTAGFTFRVKPSAAGGSSAKAVPLTILGSRPPYIAAPATPPNPQSTSKRYYIEWGTLNNLVAENWNASFDVSATTYFFAKATLRTTGSLLVTRWEIVTGPNYDSHEMPDWQIGASRPNNAVVSLGMVFVSDGVHTVAQSGGGSLVVSEHVTSIQAGSAAGEIRVGKELTYHRLAY